jgi:hypothetical protein
MPAKLSAEICEQPAPNGWSVTALVDARAELLAAELLPDREALLDPSSELLAVSAALRATATGTRARGVRFTGRVLLVEGPDDGRGIS